ncbi:carbohydrate ABC transporter permease [Caldicellulosiruptoraceae bacterium PP1]
MQKSQINKKERITKIIVSAFIIGALIIILFPYYWLLLTSIRPKQEIYNISSLITLHPQFGNYLFVFKERPFARYILNSFIIASETTIISLVIASLAAYAIAKTQISQRVKQLVLSLSLAVSMFPQITIVSPIYVIVKDLGLRNSWFGLLIPYTTFSLPLAIWYLTTFYQGVSHEIDEAAKIDGCNTFQIFYKIITPLVMPGIFTSAILIFISVWNEFLFALTINTDDIWRTVAVGIVMFQGRFTIPWDEISAAATIVMIPLIVMVFLFQQKIISGLTAGAVKE